MDFCGFQQFSRWIMAALDRVMDCALGVIPLFQFVAPAWDPGPRAGYREIFRN